MPLSPTQPGKPFRCAETLFAFARTNTGHQVLCDGPTIVYRQTPFQIERTASGFLATEIAATPAERPGATVGANELQHEVQEVLNAAVLERQRHREAMVQAISRHADQVTRAVNESGWEVFHDAVALAGIHVRQRPGISPLAPDVDAHQADSRSGPGSYRAAVKQIAGNDTTANVLLADDKHFCSNTFVGGYQDEDRIRLCFSDQPCSKAPGKHMPPAARLAYMKNGGGVWLELRLCKKATALLGLLQDPFTDLASPQAMLKLAMATAAAGRPARKTAPAHASAPPQPANDVRAQWTGYVVAADEVFGAATLFKAGVISEADAASRVPALFRDIFVSQAIDQNGESHATLIDGKVFASLAGEREAFLEDLYNTLLPSRHAPYTIEGVKPLLRDVLGVPYVLADISSLERRVSSPAPNGTEPVHLIVKWGLLRVDAQNYRLSEDESGNIVATAVDERGEKIAGFEDSAVRIAQILTEARSMARRADDVIRRFGSVLEARLEPWRCTGPGNPAGLERAAEMMFPAGSGDPRSIALLKDERFGGNALRRIVVHRFRGTFDAIFVTSDGQEEKLTFCNKNVPGRLSGLALRKLLREGNYYSLADLAAEWTLATQTNSMQHVVLSAWEEALAQAQTAHGAMPELRNAAIKRLPCATGLQPIGFQGLSIRGLMEAPPGFSSLAGLDRFLREPALLARLADTPIITIGTRSFNIRMVNGTDAVVSENKRSWTQAILSLFRLDQASRVRRLVIRHARAEAAAAVLHRRIERTLARHAKEHNGVAAYLSQAIVPRTMVSGAPHPDDLPILDDPFFCSTNFLSIQPTTDPAMFRARFRHDDRQEDVLLPEYSRIKTAGGQHPPDLQGDRLKHDLKTLQYRTLRDVVRRWSTQQIAESLASEVRAWPEAKVEGVGERMQGHRYRCDAMLSGHTFSLTDDMRLRLEAATG